MTELATTKGGMIRDLREKGITRHKDGRKLKLHKTTEVAKLYFAHRA